MKIIPLTRQPGPAGLSAIERFRHVSGSLPFLCLNDHVMLLLTPGQTEAALLREAEVLIDRNLASRPAVLVHTLPGDTRMVRTMHDLCILEQTRGASWQALYRAGMQACRRRRPLALVLPDAEDGAVPPPIFAVKGWRPGEAA